MKKEYLYFIENLRGLAILLVFFTHCISFEYFSPVFSNILKFITGNATAIFVFISGFLFHYLLQNKFEFSKYLRQKFKFVIVPYMLFITMATLLGIVFHRYEFYDMDIIQYSLWSFVVGGGIVGPLWFIPMIALYFVTAPIFFRLSKLSFKIFSAVTIGAIFVSLFTYRPFDQLNPFLSYIHFIGFYIFGIYLSTYPKVRYNLVKNRYVVFCMMIISYFILVVWDSYNFSQLGYREDSGFFIHLGDFNLLQASKFCMILFLFVLFECYLNYRNKILGYFSQISFGIFFIHGFTLLIFTRIWSKLGMFEYPILSLLCETIFALGGGVLFIYIGKKILNKWSRYVFGC